MRLRTLGNLQVEGCDFKRSKPLMLLSYLAVEGAKDRRYLSQLFWPQTSKPSHSLSKAIYRLKQGLDSHESSANELIQSDDQMISTRIEVDVLTLLDCLEQNDLKSAVELYQGDFLASVNVLDIEEELEQWILQTRDYLAKRMQVAYLSLAQQQFAQTSGDSTQTSLQYVEKAYKVLDSSLSSPDVIQALFKQLRLCKSPLADVLFEEVQDFGIDLTYDVISDDVISDSATSELTKSTSFETITEVETQESDLDSSFRETVRNSTNEHTAASRKKRLQSLFRIENQSVTKFVGRKKELSEVIKLFNEEHVRLLSLVGIGGSGKTRLAIEIADYIAEDVTLSIAIQEHYFVNLQTAKTPEVARFLLAETLGLEPDLNTDIVPQLIEHIGQRSLLIILDSFEHLIDDSGRLPELLYRCPNLYLIVTSRERLNLPEEWILHIRGLSYQLDSQDSKQTISSVNFSNTSFTPSDLDAWRDVDAIKFFAERAKQADVRFDLEENFEGVIELCFLVAGLPLALELAASWVRHMPCKQIVTEVKQSLDLLYRDSQYAQDHHTSIRAVFEHSWQLLNPREETIFASLAIFKQGFRREAAAAVADASIVQLAIFLDKSLLSLDSGGRYQCHPLLEQFMVEKLAELEIDQSALAAKHAAFYSDYLLILKADFRNGVQKVSSFRDDFENFNAAWYYNVEQENFEFLPKLLTAFRVFFEHLHRYNDAIELLNKAVQKLFQSYEPEYSEAHPALLSFRLGQAWAYCSSDYVQSEELAKEAIELAVLHDDDVARGFALRILGEIALEHTGDKVKAKAHFDQALALAQRIGDIDLSARCWRYLAVIAVSNGDNEAALEFQRTALKQFENLGDKVGIADCRCEVGHLLVLAKRADEAEVYLLESLKLSKEIDFKLGIVNSLCFLGDVAFDRKQYEKAEEYYHGSLELSEEIHDYYGVAGGYMDLATAAAAQKNVTTASCYFYQALEKAVSLNVKPLQLSILTHVAILKLEHNLDSVTSGSVNNSSSSIVDAVAMLRFIESQDETDQYDKDLIQEQFDTYKDKYQTELSTVLNAEAVEGSLVEWSTKTLQELKDYEHLPTFELVV